MCRASSRRRVGRHRCGVGCGWGGGLADGRRGRRASGSVVVLHRDISLTWIGGRSLGGDIRWASSHPCARVRARPWASSAVHSKLTHYAQHGTYSWSATGFPLALACRTRHLAARGRGGRRGDRTRRTPRVPAGRRRPQAEDRRRGVPGWLGHPVHREADQDVRRLQHGDSSRGDPAAYGRAAGRPARQRRLRPFHSRSSRRTRCHHRRPVAAGGAASG